MAGTLAFSRFVIKDIFRNKGRTLSSIIGVVLAVSLIAGENIALDTTARDVLAEELKDFKYDLLGASEDILSTEDVRTMEDQLESKFGVKESLAMTHLATRFEIHNSSTIITPTYGYNEKRVDIQVPQNGTLWLNTSLEQIPHKTYKLYGNVYSLHNGKPVEKITVKAYEMQSVTWYEGYSTYINTTESGYYELFLPASEHEIRVELGDSTYHIERVNITSSEPEKHLDFHIYDIESSSIEGYVKDPRTGDPYTGSLYIEIWNHTIPHSNFTSIEKGYYHINTVPGNISVKGLSGSWRGPFTNHSQVAVASNSIVWLNLTVVIDPVEDVLLEGYVYDQMSSAPIYHAWVIVQSLDFDYWYDEWTNDLGYFNLNISHGNVSIYVYESGYMEEEMKLSVLAGETRQLNFFLKHMNSSIKGYVYTADGAPLEGAHIEVLDTYRLGKTNQYGYYDIRITAGDYTITIDAKADDYPIIHEDIWIETYSFLESQRNIDFFGELAPYELKAGVMEIGDGKIVIANHTAEQYDLNVGDEI
ncbi:MAG: carboxypeptidase regulatory-like domain-containing protein, partial [Thermoplasmata archaeon]